MDDNNRRRRRDGPPYAPLDPRSTENAGQTREFSSSSERYRTAPLMTSQASSRVAGSTPGYPGYYQEPTSSFSSGLPTAPQQYQPGYSQDPRQQQSFGTYNPDLIYNNSPQAPQSAVYESTQQFQTRQASGMQMLPEAAGPFFQNEPTSASSASGLQHHTSLSSSIYQHQQSPASRALHQGFPGSLTMGAVPQSASEGIGQEGLQTQALEVDAGFATYQATLRGIFQNVVNGRLADAGQSLLEASEWLLGHVGDLGLNVDEVSLHAERIQLWGEFNTAWLSIFQKQKDMLESGQQIHPPRNLLTQEFINKMANDLIRMCDAIEKHGLVDYQYGVAEEQIIIALTECLDVQESIEGVNQGSGLDDPAPEKSSS